MQRAKGEDAFEKMLRIAAERGGEYSKGNRWISIQRLSLIEPLFGKFLMPKGHVICGYYSSRIFSIDFDKKLVTDYGMPSYSVSTGQNIRAWEAAFRVFFKPFLPENLLWQYSRWTSSPRYVRPEANTRFKRFTEKAPWVHVDGERVAWFYWPAWDEALANRYGDGEAFLRENQNWRYFDYAWDSAGNWTRFFLSEEARHRWTARERRKGRLIDGNLSAAIPVLP